MRMPIGLYPIGLVLLISVRTGHYGFGGALSAAYVAGGCIGNPLIGRLIDQRGQRAVLRPAVAVQVLATVTIVVLAQFRAPDASLLVPALLVGLAYPPVGSLTRARWSHAVPPGPTLTAAYSLESSLDEVIFVIGPPIVTVVAAEVSPVLSLVLAAALAGAGGLWLARQRATEPPAHPREHGVARVSAVRQPGMRLLLLATVGVGAFFASVEVTIVAYCGQHGEQALGGLVLAGLATGSAMSGFLYGARRWRLGLRQRFRIQAIVFGLLPLLFLLTVDVTVLAICAFVVGIGIAPMLITVYGLIESIVPAAALTEGFSWLTTGLGVGYGLAAAVTGQVADAYGARTAFAIPYASGLLAAVTALLVYRVLRAAESQPAASPSR